MDQKQATFKLTSALLDKATKSPTAINVVASFGLYMFSEWAKLAKPLIKAAGEKSTSGTGWVDSFIAEIDKTMGEFPDIIKDDQIQYVDYLYKYFKNDFIKKNKIKVVAKAAEVPEIVPILWVEKDIEALEAITRMSTQSTGNFYKGSVQQVVRDSIQKNVLESNLSREEAVARMQRDLSKALKMEPGQLESEVVPAGYRGTAESYFSGLADHTASISRTMGAITTMDEIDVQTMVVRSVRSNRTCVGCIAMDGQTYKVSTVKTHMNKLLAADNIDDLKEAQPWFHFKTPDEYSEKGLAEASAKAQTIVEGNIQIPPFHFRCECFVDMV